MTSNSNPKYPPVNMSIHTGGAGASMGKLTTTTINTGSIQGGFTTYANQIYGPTRYHCSVCENSFELSKMDLRVMYLQGFWFCNDLCRIEFVFRQLLRTESIEG